MIKEIQGDTKRIKNYQKKDAVNQPIENQLKENGY